MNNTVKHYQRGEYELTLTDHYERVDVRRERRYGRECKVYVTAPAVTKGAGANRLADLCEDARQLSPYHVFWEVMKRLAPEALDASSHTPWTEGSVTVRWGVFVPADKPSAICAEEEARAKLPPDEELFRLVAQARDEAQAEYNKRYAAAELYVQVARLLDWYTGEVGKKAKEVTRYKQRLAALQAELEAEVDAQVQPMLVEAGEALEKDLAKGEEAEYSREAVELFAKLAPSYLAVPEHKPIPANSGGLPFGRGNYMPKRARWVKEQTK